MQLSIELTNWAGSVVVVGRRWIEQVGRGSPRDLLGAAVLKKGHEREENKDKDAKERHDDGGHKGQQHDDVDGRRGREDGGLQVDVRRVTKQELGKEHGGDHGDGMRPAECGREDADPAGLVDRVGHKGEEDLPEDERLDKIARENGEGHHAKPRSLNGLAGELEGLPDTDGRGHRHAEGVRDSGEDDREVKVDVAIGNGRTLTLEDEDKEGVRYGVKRAHN